MIHPCQRPGDDLFTLYGDTATAIEDATEAIREQSPVYDVAEMTRDHQPTSAERATPPASCWLTTTAWPRSARSSPTEGSSPPSQSTLGRTRSTGLSSLVTAATASKPLFDEIRRVAGAEITVMGVTQASRESDDSLLPLTRLSSRQREVFRLAQMRGYYNHPRQANAGDLAAELGVSTSTIHEHLEGRGDYTRQEQR